MKWYKLVQEGTRPVTLAHKPYDEPESTGTFVAGVDQGTGSIEYICHDGQREQHTCPDPASTTEAWWRAVALFESTQSN
jgi:hypothetical protein